MKKVVCAQIGSVDGLQMVETEIPHPKPNEVLVKNRYAGVNYIDIYHRRGIYAAPDGFTPGVESAGTITSIGSEVQGFHVGQRVGALMHMGSCSEYQCIPSNRIIPLPDNVPFDIAAALLLQGITAQYLLNSTVDLKKGEKVLIHAGAGGVGHLMIQMARFKGLRVFTTVSTSAKARLASESGADEIINYQENDFLKVVLDRTSGVGLRAVFDSVGKTTFKKSLEALMPRGTLVLFGQSSGPVEPFDPSLLSRLGSLYLTRPSLTHYIQSQEELHSRASSLFGLWLGGSLKERIDSIFPMSDIAQTHIRLESRTSTGKILLEI